MFQGGAVGSFNEKILSVIRSKGPSLPIQIARAVNLQPLFAAAFLAELSSEQKLKISNLKVGSSPLYFLPGQEYQLEQFIEHLNQREREAFLLLKRSEVLDDEAQTPVMRVALRAIHDFAIPLRIRVNGEQKIFWKYFGMSDDDAMNRVEKMISGIEVKESARVQKEIVPEVQPALTATYVPNAPTEPEIMEVAPVTETPLLTAGNEKKIEEILTEAIKTVETVSPEGQDKEEEAGESKKKKKKPKKDILQPVFAEVAEVLPKKEVPQSEFGDRLTSYLESKEIALLEVLMAKKKDFVAKVRVNSPIGAHEYYLIAKDKKSVSDDDLAVALQKAQSEKMLALFMAPGVLSKKASTYLQEWRNLVKFEQILG